MTRDDIIHMAREAGFDDFFTRDLALERFATLVAAAEREECAQICYGLAFETAGDEAEGMRQCAATIRARGET